MDDCVFCKIVKGKIPSKKVYEDDDLIAFWDIEPASPVHVLIVPKNHLDNLNSAEESNQMLLGKIQLVAKKLALELKTDGAYKLTTNIGKRAGQTVFHMHYHLVGGWKDEDVVKSELVN